MKHLIRKIVKSNRPWYDQLFFYALTLISVLVPLLFTFRIKSVFTLPKLYPLGVLMLAASFFLAAKVVREREMILRKTKFNALLGLYALTLIVSTLLSINIYSSIFGIYGRLIGLMTLGAFLLFTFYLVNFVRDKTQQVALVVTSYITSIVIAVLGLLQHYGHFLTEVKITAVGMRAFSTLGHANHFGGYLVQFMCVSGMMFFLTKNKILRGLIMVANLLSFAALLQTSSRGALLALLGCIVFIVAMLALLNRSQVKKTLATLTAVVVLGVGGIFLFWDQVRQIEVVDRTVSTIEFMQSGKVPDRISWMLSSMEMMRDKPLFGHGVSTYKDAYNDYRRLDYRVPADEQDRIVPESAHNEYLNIGATQGGLALFIYLALLVYVFKTGIRAMLKTKDQEERYSLLFLMAGVLAYLLQVFVNFGVVGTMLPFFLLLGVTQGYALNVLDQEEEITLKSPVTYVVLALVLIFTVTHMSHLNRMMKADFLLRASEYLPVTAEQGYTKRIEALKAATTYNPYTFDLYDALADIQIDEGLRIARAAPTQSFLEQALDSYNKSIALNSNQALTFGKVAQVYDYLAEIHIQLGNPDKVKEAYELASLAHEEALKRSQNNPLYRDRAASLYMKKGETGDFSAYTRALELYEEIKKIRPEYPGIDDKINSVKTKLTSS